jgi:hypothetical protein
MVLEPTVPKFGIWLLCSDFIIQNNDCVFALEHFIPNTRVFGSCEVVNEAEFVLRVVIAAYERLFDLRCGRKPTHTRGGINVASLLNEPTKIHRMMYRGGSEL